MNPLVHCAQGKSRSGVICIGFLALIKPTVTVEDLAKEVKSRRGMPPKTSKLRTIVLVYDSLPERMKQKFPPSTAFSTNLRITELSLWFILLK